MSDEPIDPTGDQTPPTPPDGEFSTVNIEDEVRSSFLAYSMSVIISRALPDVRDGLKPVHRRILYAMNQEGLLSNRPYSKTAGVVGEVLKHYHPHGDRAVYDSMMVQMLIGDPQGFAEYFELISDNPPWTRVYRVKPL